ncbi:CPCC family cysteine-rich protein [Micromonospora sp. NPDC051296]|uniref:CPCC family cysteine-rich protein n=1 Tax=Micromonospora sp. NPDC051296 TaxID=3155046 RepID=UPI00341FA325
MIYVVSGVFPCPCCGRLTFAGGPGSYEICPVCFWEDDQIQLRWPNWSGGANKPSLIEAQATFARIGVCEERLVRHVRQPLPDEPVEPGWRPVEPGVDRFEPTGVQETGWPAERTALYWWRATFWRRR